MARDDEHAAWLRLALAEPHGGRLLGARLAQALGGARAALEAPTTRLVELVGRDRARDLRRAWTRARPRRVLRRAAEHGQRVLTPASDAWPADVFAGLTDAPCALFARGTLPAAGAAAAGIVGTRDATPYGTAFAHRLGRDLAAAGVWVVSGFALGIDGAAHEGCVVGGGPTLAVLGSGVDHPYPSAHVDLRDDLLAAGGGVVSEHPPGTEPRKHHFPRRNRLVAAFVQALVVVEAPARSGALITARLALDLGREILAVPGNVGQRARTGCHRLLREGATLCESAADVLHAIGLDLPDGPGLLLRAEPRGEAGLVWRALDAAAPVDAGALCARTGLAPDVVAAALVELELAGRARRTPSGGVLRA